MAQDTIEEFALSELNHAALYFQELLTTIVRIRAGGGRVQALEDFRENAIQLLQKGEERMRKRGYSDREATEFASFAVVAFLDESVLSSSTGAFRGYSTSPIGAEKYGAHIAGEVFFEKLDVLLHAQDSTRVADLLEIFQLCLLLGYRGRYGPGRDGELRSYQDRIAEKLLRIRGASSTLAPFVLPSGDALPADRDVWSERLTWIAVSTVLLAFVLLIVYRLALSSALFQLGS